MGKDSTPRSCFSPQFRANYDTIDWSRKDLTKPRPCATLSNDEPNPSPLSGVIAAGLEPVDDSGPDVPRRFRGRPNPVVPTAHTGVQVDGNGNLGGLSGRCGVADLEETEQGLG